MTSSRPIVFLVPERYDQENRPAAHRIALASAGATVVQEWSSSNPVPIFVLCHWTDRARFEDWSLICTVPIIFFTGGPPSDIVDPVTVWQRAIGMATTNVFPRAVLENPLTADELSQLVEKYTAPEPASFLVPAQDGPSTPLPILTALGILAIGALRAQSTKAAQVARPSWWMNVLGKDQQNIVPALERELAAINNTALHTSAHTLIEQVYDSKNVGTDVVKSFVDALEQKDVKRWF